MQIALTKRLADALDIRESGTPEEENPLFSWTANWTNVWADRKRADMLVLVNNATRFTIAVYQVRKKDLKNGAALMRTAIEHTLLRMNVNPDLVSAYLRLAGDVVLTKNHNRRAVAWLNHAGLECAFDIGNRYAGVDRMFCDTLGISANYRLVNYSVRAEEAFYPYETMWQALSGLTGLPVYRYRAFELLVTLDLQVYQATRRIIVPAHLDFAQLHKVIQKIFRWQDYHLYEFVVPGESGRNPVATIVPFSDTPPYDEDVVSAEEEVLSTYLPEHRRIVYTYNMGEYWEHTIELVRVMDEHDEESPRLLEAVGQAPPEDVGGVDGFVRFRGIMLDPEHPEHEEMKEWAEYWSAELREWDHRPGVIRLNGI